MSKVIRGLSIMVMVAMVATTGGVANAVTNNENLKCEQKIVSGGLTDIGNEIELYSREMGEGYATVVFETGYGDGLERMEDSNGELIDSFSALQNSVSKYTRTIAYERTGLGHSTDVGNMSNLSSDDKEILINGGIIDYSKEEFIGMTKTPRDKAINLYKLLKAKNIPAPYIIVNHSIGGYTAIEFAKLYGDELAGVVFVDSTARSATGECIGFFKKYIPEAADMILNQFTSADGTLDEVLMGENQVKHDENALRNIPILYLESDQGNQLGGEMGAEWKALRNPQVQDILSLSNDSEYKLIEGSGHYVHLDKPEETLKAVMDFVYKVEYMK